MPAENLNFKRRVSTILAPKQIIGNNVKRGTTVRVFDDSDRGEGQGEGAEGGCCGNGNGNGDGIAHIHVQKSVSDEYAHGSCSILYQRNSIPSLPSSLLSSLPPLAPVLNPPNRTASASSDAPSAASMNGLHPSVTGVRRGSVKAGVRSSFIDHREEDDPESGPSSGIATRSDKGILRSEKYREGEGEGEVVVEQMVIKSVTFSESQNMVYFSSPTRSSASSSPQHYPNFVQLRLLASLSACYDTESGDVTPSPMSPLSPSMRDMTAPSNIPSPLHSPNLKMTQLLIPSNAPLSLMLPMSPPEGIQAVRRFSVDRSTSSPFSPRSSNPSAQESPTGETVSSVDCGRESTDSPNPFSSQNSPLVNPSYNQRDSFQGSNPRLSTKPRPEITGPIRTESNKRLLDTAHLIGVQRAEVLETGRWSVKIPTMNRWRRPTETAASLALAAAGLREEGSEKSCVGAEQDSAVDNSPITGSLLEDLREEKVEGEKGEGGGECEEVREEGKEKGNTISSSEKSIESGSSTSENTNTSSIDQSLSALMSDDIPIETSMIFSDLQMTSKVVNDRQFVTAEKSPDSLSTNSKFVATIISQKEVVKVVHPMIQKEEGKVVNPPVWKKVEKVVQPATNVVHAIEVEEEEKVAPLLAKKRASQNDVKIKSVVGLWEMKMQLVKSEMKLNGEKIEELKVINKLEINGNDYKKNSTWNNTRETPSKVGKIVQKEKDKDKEDNGNKVSALQLWETKKKAVKDELKKPKALSMWEEKCELIKVEKKIETPIKEVRVVKRMDAFPLKEKVEKEVETPHAWLTDRTPVKCLHFEEEMEEGDEEDDCSGSFRDVEDKLEAVKLFPHFNSVEEEGKEEMQIIKNEKTDEKNTQKVTEKVIETEREVRTVIPAADDVDHAKNGSTKLTIEIDEVGEIDYWGLEDKVEEDTEEKKDSVEEKETVEVVEEKDEKMEEIAVSDELLLEEEDEHDYNNNDSGSETDCDSTTIVMDKTWRLEESVCGDSFYSVKALDLSGKEENEGEKERGGGEGEGEGNDADTEVNTIEEDVLSAVSDIDLYNDEGRERGRGGRERVGSNVSTALVGGYSSVDIDIFKSFHVDDDREDENEMSVTQFQSVEEKMADVVEKKGEVQKDTRTKSMRSKAINFFQGNKSSSISSLNR